MAERVPAETLPPGGGPFLRRRHVDVLQAWWDEGGLPPLVVEGAPGTGKSTILEMFARSVYDASRKGVRIYFSRGVPETDAVLNLCWLGEEHGQRVLVVCDDVDDDGGPDSGALRRLVKEWASVGAGVLIASRPVEDRHWPESWQRLHLPPAMDVAESVRLLKLQSGMSSLAVDRLARAAAGSPLLLRLLGELAMTEPVESILGRLDIERLQTVFPSDGSLALEGPGDPQSLEHEVDIRLRAVNDALIALLARQPELMYQIRPRQFEELMAELYSRQGFEVELTQQTQDGGVDLYVVSYGPAGKAVTLVDVKRYRPTHPVGVALVRQMYGVVEAQRATAGVIATTSFFTSPARHFQETVPYRMALVDYRDLRRMLQYPKP
jgi:restriction system protein